ncbi:DUF4114 domain-containing protein [Desulfoluna spongiiphila]|uniref:PEP-CTERM protein-sorting domain-containing protein n=1 Tax=Desulfoluna spongiiphila TaxID=419481 RepID=A0A1G5ET59_9BACT|nr:DUF4114 domain-containing protein [Desulfoluna spongiiphila]SCY30195.1 PEP-CTERM protein-sorting domain-containing protein [Desulfoluna spongiiphila]
MNHTTRYALLGLLFLALSTPVQAKESPIQSFARPFGLDIAAPVMKAGSDDRSSLFQSDVLPSMNSWINTNLGENVSINDTTSIALDPSNLAISTASEARVYFVGEGAGYKNTLGFNTEAGGTGSGDPKLIFPDATSRVSSYDPGPGKSQSRSRWYPLYPGDFVDIGNLEANSQLDFFLIANGARGGTMTYSTDTSINPDGIDHVVAYAMPSSPYLLVGFEDLYGGGDRDFNDLLFAVDIGAANVAALTSVPEPATLLTLVSFLIIGFTVHRQRRTA